MALERLLVPILCAFWIAAPALAQSDALREAAAALGRQDYAAAEKALRLALGTRPEDPSALGLLAVVLDNEGKYDEAGKYYERALTLTPRSVSLLNNFGNHLLATKQNGAARAIFLKVIVLNPGHPNANAQLARLSLDDKAGAAALRYLDRLPAEAQRSHDITLLRIRAFYLLKRSAEATSLLEGVSAAAGSDSRLSFSAGLALAAAGQYEKAEGFLSQALKLGLADFDVLYNLGLAASHAGHIERASSVLRAALQQRPDDVDVLYNLGAIEVALKRNEDALGWLARAAKLAPDRSDIHYLVAQTTFTLGYYPDSALAWDRYLKLAPKDDAARRERGLARALAGQLQEGLADLEWYVVGHPGDATGHYETAVAQALVDEGSALRHLDKAIALQPDFTPAYYARGVLLYKQNKPEAALADLALAARREPDNSTTLDQLGRTYLALDRVGEAVPVLRKAAELNPKDTTTLMHLSRALSAAGQPDEARQVIARFRALRSVRAGGIPAAGYVEFLGLTAEQQYERYRTQVEKMAARDPTNVSTKLRYLLLLLGEENWPKAEQTAREIVALKPDPARVAEAGRALLDAKRYTAAKELLRECPQAPGAALDLAIAVFHADGSEAGLQLMDGIPQAQRDGDYHLARAQMLDNAGQFKDAVASVNLALRAAPTRVDLYCEVALFLMKNRRLPAALELLDRATHYLGENPSILLTKAIALEVADRRPEAPPLMKEIIRRWPEWSHAHLVYGITLRALGNYEEALRELTTALALGARAPAAYLYLADATLKAKPDDIDSAQKAIQTALALDPADPWVQAVAGRISFERRDYESALKQLQEAVRLRPRMVQAHYTLARVYQAMGRSEEARKEVEQVRLLRERFPDETNDPDLLHSNVFAVSPPRR